MCGAGCATDWGGGIYGGFDADDTDNNSDGHGDDRRHAAHRAPNDNRLRCQGFPLMGPTFSQLFWDLSLQCGRVAHSARAHMVARHAENLKS